MRQLCLPGRFTIAEIEGIQRNTWEEQTGTKMKLMRLPFAVNNAERLEVRVLEFVQAAQFGRLSIETLPAQYPVTALDRPKMDDVVVGCDLAAVAAPGSFGFLAVSAAHFHEESQPARSMGQ